MKPAKHLIDADGAHSVNCFPCKLQTISFAPSAMPTRSPDAARAKTKDPELEKDMSSYRALRRDGLQPKAVKGAHALAQSANEAFEVTTGRVVENSYLRHRAAEAYRDMPKPSSDPIVRETA